MSCGGACHAKEWGLNQPCLYLGNGSLEAAGGIEPPYKGFADQNETPVRYGNFHACALIAPFYEVFHVVLNCMFFVFIPARSRQKNHCVSLRHGARRCISFLALDGICG